MEFKIGDIVLFEGSEATIIAFSPEDDSDSILLDISLNHNFGWVGTKRDDTYTKREGGEKIDVSKYIKCWWVSEKMIELKNPNNKKPKEDLSMEKLILKKLIKLEKNNGV